MSIQRYIRVASMALVMAPWQAGAQVSTDVVWQRSLGGGDFDIGYDLRATSDGGFICLGHGLSADGDLTGSHGNTDMLVAKLDADGVVQWTRVLGGASAELGATCLEASDGSFMITGLTGSNDGDVSGNHGSSDVWVLKLSPLGITVWQRTYGGSSAEAGSQIRETADGGFVILSNTSSDDGDVVGFHPGVAQDAWILKIDASGNVEWSRALGGSGTDTASGLVFTSDGGFLVNFGYTESDDGDVSNYHGSGDGWVVKLTSAGQVEWSRTVGGSQREMGLDILELDNGDFMWLGWSASNDGDVPLNRGGHDVLLARLSRSGQLIWVRTYGGSLDDLCRSILPMSDGGFLVVGGSWSSDGDVSVNRGGQDVWVFKVDANGSLLWQRSFGGSMDESAFVYEGNHGGYLLSGITNSDDGDMQGGHGGMDLWMAGLTTNGDLRWQRCLGGSAEDWGYLKAQTPDTGYVAFGYTSSNDGDVFGNYGDRDMWVVKLKVNDPAVPPECVLYIPNAFSPDNSMKNDGHCLYGTDCVATMQLNIYDRWGSKVFESTDPNSCWDGTFNGQALDPAVFVYHLSATLNNGEAIERQGNISLLK